MSTETERMNKRRDESRSALYRKRIGSEDETQGVEEPKPGSGDEPTKEAKKAQRGLNFLSKFW